MSQAYISDALRLQVTVTFKHRCGYCLTREDIIGSEMTIDHIVPETLGGVTQLHNLCLACWKCNLLKSDRITAMDPLSGELVRLFNPNTQKWFEHFQWHARGLFVAGRSAVGRATIIALQLNRPQLVRSRELWIEAGWRPPKE